MATPCLVATCPDRGREHDHCAAAEHCVGYDKRTKLAPLVWDNPLCDDCLRVAERDIRALALDWRDLCAELIPSLGQWGDGQPPALGERAMLLRGDVDALQREICHVLTTWEEIIRDHAGLSAPAVRGHVQAAVDAAVIVLAPRVAQLACVGPTACYPTGCEDAPTEVSGAQAIGHLRRLRGRARRILGLSGDTRHLPGHCRRCSRPDLRQDNGSDTVYCGHCDDRQTRDEYERYGNLFARETA